jgi:hypothetical protein
VTNCGISPYSTYLFELNHSTAPVSSGNSITNTNGRNKSLLAALKLRSASSKGI